METQMHRELLVPVLLAPKAKGQPGQPWTWKGCPKGQKEAETQEILTNTTAACQRVALSVTKHCDAAGCKFDFRESPGKQPLINQRNLLHITPCHKVHWNLIVSDTKSPKKPNALQVGDAG